jgi:hypothetical protein
MKIYLWFLLMVLFLMSSGTCSRPPVDEDPAEVRVLGLFSGETDQYFIPLIKVRFQENSYINHCIFVHIDSSGHILRAPGREIDSPPNVEQTYQTGNGNLIISGNLSMDMYYYRQGFWELSPENELLREQRFPDRIGSLCPAADGNMFYFGSAHSDTGSYDDLLYMKQTPAGDTLWQRRIPVSTNSYFTGGVPLSDNGCLALGTVWFRDRANDMFLARIAPGGDILWTGTYGGDRHDDMVTGLELSDGGFLVAGRLDVYDSTNTNWSLAYGQQIYLIKLSSDGIKDWSHPFGNTLREMPVEILESRDGNYILLGLRDESYAYLFDEPMGWVSKITPQGQTLWTVEFPGRIPAGIQELSSGNYLIAASRIEPASYYNYIEDFSLIKVSASGTALWDKALTP